jgi:hypothetical protein
VEPSKCFGFTGSVIDIDDVPVETERWCIQLLIVKSACTYNFKFTAMIMIMTRQWLGSGANFHRIVFRGKPGPGVIHGGYPRGISTSNPQLFTGENCGYPPADLPAQGWQYRFILSAEVSSLPASSVASLSRRAHLPGLSSEGQ